MTGTIVLASTGFQTNNGAGYSVNQYGNFTHMRTNSNDTWGIVGANGEAFKVAFDTGDTTVIGTITAPTMTCTTSQPQCIEIRGMSGSAGHGGFIDFHFNNSTADYTSRIIEGASGTLSVSNNLTVNNLLTCTGNGMVLRGNSNPQFYFRNNSNQEIGSIWANGSGRIYIRERASAGSSYATDIVFPAASTNSSTNKYVYTSDNFSLSGTTLTIIPPS